MKAPFSLFLALRYLKPKRTFVSMITLISILGVTLGITVLIIVISVMTGFDQELRKKVLGFEANVYVTNELTLPSLEEELAVDEGASPDKGDTAEGVIRDWRPLDEEICKTSGVVASAPFVMGPVIVEFKNRKFTPKIRGIDTLREESVTPGLEGSIKWGHLDLDGDKTVIGSRLAEILRIRVGDKLIVYSPKNLGRVLAELKKAEEHSADKKDMTALRQMFLPQELTVTGIFETGRYIYDSEIVLVPLYIGQELYDLGDAVHGISIRTSDPYLAGNVKQSLESFLPPPLHGTTWIENNGQLFDAIAMERNVMFFLLLFIVIVAAFGIMNTLITVTVQKTREIGIMKALGASTGQIVWVFLAQGMVVGVFGNLTGLAAGIALVRWRNEFKEWLATTLGIEVFPEGIYQFREIPAQIVPHDVAIICISAFVICSLAALIPAFFAARLDPVVALRYE